METLSLGEYVSKHIKRGECTCGKCFDSGQKSEQDQSGGDTVDLTFFKVFQEGGDREEFLRLVTEKYPEWLDGKEHNYIDIGAQIGDQGLALATIGLGHLLGVWEARSPDTMMPFLPKELKNRMAQMGLVTLCCVGG